MERGRVNRSVDTTTEVAGPNRVATVSGVHHATNHAKFFMEGARAKARDWSLCVPTATMQVQRAKAAVAGMGGERLGSPMTDISISDIGWQVGGNGLSCFRWRGWKGGQTQNRACRGWGWREQRRRGSRCRTRDIKSRCLLLPGEKMALLTEWRFE